MPSAYSRDEGTVDSIGNETPSSSRPLSNSGVRPERTEVPSSSKSQDVNENTKKKDDPNENQNGEPSKPAEIDDDHYE